VRIGNTTLLGINAASGIIFIILMMVKFNSYIIGLSSLFFTLILLVLEYFGEGFKLRKKISTFRYSGDVFDRWINSGIFFLNLIIYIILIFYPTTSTDSIEGKLIILSPILLFIYVLYLDLGRLGRVLARKRFADGLPEES